MSTRLAVVVLVASLLGGCSDAPTEGDVSGTVSVDGKLAESGAVSFFPLDGRSATSGGTIINGKYSFKAPLGPSKVEIRVSTKIGERKLYDTPDSPTQPLLKEVLPAKYNDASELQYDVVAGPQEKNWDLKTK